MAEDRKDMGGSGQAAGRPQAGPYSALKGTENWRRRHRPRPHPPSVAQIHPVMHSLSFLPSFFPASFCSRWHFNHYFARTPRRNPQRGRHTRTQLDAVWTRLLLTFIPLCFTHRIGLSGLGRDDGTPIQQISSDEAFVRVPYIIRSPTSAPQIHALKSGQCR